MATGAGMGTGSGPGVGEGAVRGVGARLVSARGGRTSVSMAALRRGRTRQGTAVRVVQRGTLTRGLRVPRA